MFSRLRWLVLLLSAVTSSAVADEPDLERDIRPLLLRHCSGCHGATVQKGGLRLDARHSFLKGGDSGPGLEEVRKLLRIALKRRRIA
ncbi:MAG UNVERIFIED_CONTAM: hypothetical protein LVR18_42095 [Planctomycetaceae bacterium]|jgi:mono/diheme cytochrome c family protein